MLSIIDSELEATGVCTDAATKCTVEGTGGSTTGTLRVSLFMLGKGELFYLLLLL